MKNYSRGSNPFKKTFCLFVWCIMFENIWVIGGRHDSRSRDAMFRTKLLSREGVSTLLLWNGVPDFAPWPEGLCQFSCLLRQVNVIVLQKPLVKSATNASIIASLTKSSSRKTRQCVHSNLKICKLF